MFSGCFFTKFVRSVICVVGSDLFIVLVVGLQSEGWLGGGTFLLSFVLFGGSFSF